MKKNPASSFKMIKGTLGFLLVVALIGYGGHWGYNKYGTKVNMSGGALSNTAYAEKHVISRFQLSVGENNNVYLTGNMSNSGDRKVKGIRVSIDYGEMQSAARGKGWPAQMDLGGLAPGQSKQVKLTAFKIPGKKVKYFSAQYTVRLQRVFM